MPNETEKVFREMGRNDRWYHGENRRGFSATEIVRTVGGIKIINRGEAPVKTKLQRFDQIKSSGKVALKRQSLVL